MTQHYIVKIQELIEMFGSSLELWAIYGWIISLLEAIIITGFMYWQMLPMQAFPRVSSLIKTKEGTGKGINSLAKTSI